MIKEFEEAGFESTMDDANDEPDAVVVGFDMSLVYSRLCRAAWWINQKKLYLATNPDRICPTDKSDLYGYSYGTAGKRSVGVGSFRRDNV